jgi:predicted AAA+ superfamily ATPase
MTDISESGRYERYEFDFVWLVDSNVALSVYNVEEPQAPLILNQKRNIFKFFLSDTGLLVSMLPKAISQNILAHRDNLNYGSLYENIFAQELISREHNVYYYNSKKYGELDFVIEGDSGLASVFEVKSGKDYTRHRALNNILDIKNYKFEDIAVFTNDNVLKKDRIRYLPVYMVMFL